MPHKIGEWLRRLLSLDNLAGALLGTGLFTAGAAVAGLIAHLPPLTIAGLVVGVGYIAVAAVLGWRDGWRPGTMRGTRGWKADVLTAPGARLVLVLTPPPDADAGLDLIANVQDAMGGGSYAASGDQVGKPGQVVVNGQPSDYFFITYPPSHQAIAHDGAYQARWWSRTELGLQPLASKRFRIKRGALV